MIPKAPGRTGLVLEEPLLFEIGHRDQAPFDLPDWDVERCDPKSELPAHLIRAKAPELPEITEPEVVRHYTRLSTWNYSLDAGFYPLGSCTMKYNPKVNDKAASLAGFAQAHPYAPMSCNQGLLNLLNELKHDLKEISGMDEVCLHPAAGSHGELLGIMLIKAYQQDKGQHQRTKILIPDSAHGTNPASASICDYESVELPSGPDGLIDMAALDRLMTDEVAGIMLTNPNTCGIFESRIKEVCRIVHERGGMVYFDGANLNALTGISRPGDMGADVLHFNTHKTFSTPHGGGGPGAGPIGLKKELIPFLPKPILEEDAQGNAYYLDQSPKSIGRIRSFTGNIGVLIRAWTYIRSLGGKGLREMTEQAVLNANYIKAKLQQDLHVPFGDQHCMHEVLFTDQKQHDQHITTMDLAKGLIEKGFHPPTVYFPLVVQGALLVEPTETESQRTMDNFVHGIKELLVMDADTLHAYPSRTFVGRVDEVQAARKPILRWRAE